MPFTFSHTAATLLFRPWLQKQKLSATGLILGCMAPDFEYFLRMKMQGDLGHHFVGIFLVDIPVSIILALFIHIVIRDQFIEHLPYFLRQRFIVFQHHDWFSYFIKNIWMVVISIFLGILTHIVWDAFTHKTGFFVQQMPFLQQMLYLGNISIPVFKFLQYLSGVLGLWVVMMFIYKMPVSQLPESQNHTQKMFIYWSMILLCFITLFSWKMQLNSFSVQSLVTVLVVAIPCFFWSVLGVSALFKYLRLNNQKPEYFD